jgi:hypothetical protein
MAGTQIPAHAQPRHARPRRKPRRRSRSLWLLPAALLSALLLLAGGVMAYLLWPVWPQAVATDAPALPITISGVAPVWELESRPSTSPTLMKISEFSRKADMAAACSYFAV